MNEVLHANVFFFITSIAVIVFTALGCVVLIHCIKLLKSARRIVMRIEESTEIMHANVRDVHTRFSEGGVVGLLRFIMFGSGSNNNTDSKYSADSNSTPRSESTPSKRNRGQSKTSLHIKDES
ncbi:MAG TPA: hypothetical protein VFV22_00455 [Candidatus Paceibacterota bacterium]|nr:hypothetical protein [Candidatus Paceibacterota bacterium]